MDVKSAVKKAVQYIQEVFETENITNVGLEEITFDDSQSIWEVTVGFSRPWDKKPSLQLNPLLAMREPLAREYKTIFIDDETEEVKSLKIRVLNNA